MKRLLERRAPNPDTLDVNLRKVARREFIKIHRCEPMINVGDPEAPLMAEVMGKGVSWNQQPTT